MVSEAQTTTLRELGIRTRHVADTAPITFRREGYINSSIPSVSFIIPIHNMGRFLFDNIRHLSINSREKHEFVVVLDDCTDNSESELGLAAYEMHKSEFFWDLRL